MKLASRISYRSGLSLDTKSRFAIFGIGNYPDPIETRHNVGIRIVQSFARKKGLTFERLKAQNGFVAESQEREDCDHLVIVHQDRLFDNHGTNLSGSLVRTVMRDYEIDKKNIIIYHETLLSPLGRYRIRKFGKQHKQKSVISITKAIKSDNFYCFQFGVSKPGLKLEDQERYLSSPFDVEETGIAHEQVEKAASSIEEQLYKLKFSHLREKAMKRKKHGGNGVVEPPAFLF
mmetsp:Transcript_306/g.362  ORF Transcript_306/g.362 Transcript_306/m.362 type:complete len:232 (-) Transcript_306:781-1476(-)|eukprot:CAMPEP_0184046490 /NCGR_PEP_ID=MMETSP0956-20121227/1597_1 /TAXON_ID=627963 /ORGANISM="Aplanochytrium sp, Strain PBS07" /LENGTH=231 /DNA_ID=CAMNT_0026338103 /DNA_START=36 /DNA_END=731 /DNA_ORIENTATION=+